MFVTDLSKDGPPKVQKSNNAFAAIAMPGCSLAYLSGTIPALPFNQDSAVRFPLIKSYPRLAHYAGDKLFNPPTVTALINFSSSHGS